MSYKNVISHFSIKLWKKTFKTIQQLSCFVRHPIHIHFNVLIKNLYESKLCLNVLYFMYFKNKKKPYDYFLQKSDLIKYMIKYLFYLFIFKFYIFNNILKYLYDSRCKYIDISKILVLHFLEKKNLGHPSSFAKLQL